MSYKNLNITSNKSRLTENEKYRLVKWVGVNGGLLGPLIKTSIEHNDYGLLLVPGIIALITTPLVAKSFKKVNKRDLLRILGCWGKATAAVVPLSLGLIAFVRLSVDPSLLKNFSIGQVVKCSVYFTGMLLLIDFWIESQMKMNEFKEKGYITRQSDGSPITKRLVNTTDKLLRLFKFDKNLRIKG